MLDQCSIFHKGGIVLWSRSFTPEAAASSPANALVKESLIEGRSNEEQFERDSYAVKWSFANDLELIFVVAYQRILQLTYVDELLDKLKILFIKMFQPFLVPFVDSLHAVASGKSSTGTLQWAFDEVFAGWNAVFDSLLKSLEEQAAQDRKSRMRSTSQKPYIEETSIYASSEDNILPTQTQDSPIDAKQIAKNVEALKARIKGRGGGPGKRGGGRSRVEGSGKSEPSPGSEASTKKTKAKIQRKWGDQPISAEDMASLDYSMDTDSDREALQPSNSDLAALVDQASMGSLSSDGLYEIKDWEFGKGRAAPETASTSTLGNLLARLTGGKVLSEADLKPVLEGMKQQLMKKNVAMDIASKICEGVGENLVGKKVGGFQTTNAAVRQALSTSLTRILTPKTSTDILLAIRAKLSAPIASGSTTKMRNPYSIAFVGVNGVGKSTNLSKVCFWLLQNRMKVLIAACDTFRSGAVEQLRVHVRNLGLLRSEEEHGGVELFERGYGKDAAGIAKEAISYARDNNFDVVLIDTAGRMQDNEPLMRALAKLAAINTPDKIVFVGEALVGNEAVDQLTKFDRALRDFSGASGEARGIDGMLVTKWDTVDDKVGAALSMTYVTGQPILFVGCGQTYTDLRQLKVSNVVQAILSD